MRRIKLNSYRYATCFSSLRKSASLLSMDCSDWKEFSSPSPAGGKARFKHVNMTNDMASPTMKVRLYSRDQPIHVGAVYASTVAIRPAGLSTKLKAEIQIRT